MFAAACSSSVDLPMPGSPPSSTSDPGTMPPPSTRSNSPMPVESRACCSISMSAYKRARCRRARQRVAMRRAPARRRSRPARSSTSEFQAPQSAQRPSHFGDCAPHSWQTKTVVGRLAIVQSLNSGDLYRDRVCDRLHEHDSMLQSPITRSPDSRSPIHSVDPFDAAADPADDFPRDRCRSPRPSRARRCDRRPASR